MRVMILPFCLLTVSAGLRRGQLEGERGYELPGHPWGYREVSDGTRVMQFWNDGGIRS